MEYKYKDKLDTKVRYIVDDLSKGSVKNAKKHLDEAKQVVNNHADHDTDIYERLHDLLTIDIPTDIESAKNAPEIDDYFSDDVADCVHSIDEMLDYSIGVL